MLFAALAEGLQHALGPPAARPGSNVRTACPPPATNSPSVARGRGRRAGTLRHCADEQKLRRRVHKNRAAAGPHGHLNAPWDNLALLARLRRLAW